MSFATLKPSAHLKVQRFSSPDEFNAIGFVEVDRQVLLGSYSYSRAITALPGVLLLLEQTSPRSLEAMMNATGCTVIVPMGNQSDATFNGGAWRASAIGLLRGAMAFNLREPTPSRFSVIRFSSDMQNRGWDDVEGQLHLHNVGEHQLAQLQHVIHRVFWLSSAQMSHGLFASAAETLRQELIDALDQVLVGQASRQPGPGAFERHRKLVSRLDEFAHRHPEKPLYSEALAKEFGTSPRTLQAAVNAVHGMSLHQYLRTKRLWALRAQLTKGMPLTSISSAAMANGFAHMGDLSRLYKSSFGELPSETLLRSRNV